LKEENNETKNIFVSANSGEAFTCLKGECVKVSGTTIVDLVAFNLHDLTERFDQARTKANQGKIFISTGDWLISKRNNKMMQIVEDLFVEGRHDLQHGMCSRKRWDLLAEEHGEQKLAEYYKQSLGVSQLPDHGCFENLSAALTPWGIAPDDIPSPFNIFQDMKIDPETGKLEHSQVRPKPGSYVLLKAEMDLLVGVSACPDLIAGGGKDVTITVFQP